MQGKYEDDSERTRSWLGEREDEGNHQPFKQLFLLQGQDDNEEPQHLLVFLKYSIPQFLCRIVPQLDKVYLQNSREVIYLKRLVTTVLATLFLQSCGQLP